MLPRQSFADHACAGRAARQADKLHRKALADALDAKGLPWEELPGEGAFYGPKVEFSLKDCIGRVWQLGTIQVDFSMPERLGAAYVDEHGTPDRATIADVADHIEHVARVAGIDHVGIGADFYGAREDYELVEGLEDVSKYPALFAELLRRGWEPDALEKLSRGNVLRVMREVEAVSRR